MTAYLDCSVVLRIVLREFPSIYFSDDPRADLQAYAGL